MTTAEYLATPETVLPRELAYGTLHVADAPLVPHQRAVGQLFLFLHHHLEEHPVGDVWLSPIDVILDVDRALVVQPDLLVISNAREAIVRERIYGAPDLMIEVLSPHPRVGRIEARLAWFARYGVRECWLLHLLDDVIEVVRFEKNRIASRRLYGPGHRPTSVVLPALTATVEELIG